MTTASRIFYRLQYTLSLFLSLTVLGCSRYNVEIQARFDAALVAFEEAEKNSEQPFDHVAIMFRSIIDNGGRSGETYYNLGNALAKAGKPWEALAAYEMAQRYMPLDPYIVSNRLAILAGTLPPKERTPVLEHILFWQNWIGVEQKRLITLIIALATFIFATLTIFFKSTFLKRTSVVMFTVTVLGIVSVGYDWYRFEYQTIAVITTNKSEQEVVPRKGNSETYEAAFTTAIPLGTIARVLEQRGGWTKLKFDTDQDGWLPNENVVLCK